MHVKKNIKVLSLGMPFSIFTVVIEWFLALVCLSAQNSF
jgi:hypothetical protein